MFQFVAARREHNIVGDLRRTLFHHGRVDRLDPSEHSAASLGWGDARGLVSSEREAGGWSGGDDQLGSELFRKLFSRLSLGSLKLRKQEFS